MVRKKSGFIPITKGDEAVIQADYFGIVAEEAAKGRAVLALANYDGGKVLAFIPDYALKHLRDAVRDIARIQGQSRFSEKLRDRWTRTKRALKNLRGQPKDRLRLKSGQIRMVRADLVVVGAWKDTAFGRTNIAVSEKEGGSAIILLPDKSLSDFATAAFQAIRLARTQPDSAPGGPIPEARSRVVIPDRIEVLAEPEEALALPGYEVLELWIGGVPLQFAAKKEHWKLVLEAMINRPDV